jgi:hypothetical protein
MKKLFILAVAMSLSFGAATAQTTSDAKAAKSITAGPVITFAEKSYDFGNIQQGDVVEHVFKFKNTGTAPLVISRVDVTCGCTTPEWPKEPIAPGKSGQVKAVFNSTGKMGQQNKVITVQSNSVEGPAQVTIITNIQEKPAAGAALVKPAEGPAVTAATNASAETKVKTANGKTKTKTKK